VSIKVGVGMPRKLLVYAMTGAEGICGGIATANKNALRAMVRVYHEHNCRLAVVSLHEPSSARPNYLPAGVVFYGCESSKLRFATRLGLLSIQRAFIVVDHVTLALPTLPFALLRWCRTAIVAHGSEADDRMKASSRLSFRIADRVLTNSELTLRRLKLRIPEVRGSVCLLGLSPNIPILDELRPVSTTRLELSSIDGQLRTIGPRMLLLVARIDAGEMEKGHDAIVRALAKLRSEYPDVQAVFPGPGAGREKLIQLAIELDVADRVFLPGFVTTECLIDLYQSCFAFVMPSQQEGFGLVYLEAMNYAKSCVGCRNDGAEEVIVHEKTGLLQNDQRDIDELVSNLSRLLSNPAWNAQLGVNGKQRLQEKFSSGSHQQRFADAINAWLWAKEDTTVSSEPAPIHFKTEGES
jgi:phosphatidyl-myo-inositol dimannoside synthase